MELLPVVVHMAVFYKRCFETFFHSQIFSGPAIPNSGSTASSSWEHATDAQDTQALDGDIMDELADRFRNASAAIDHAGLDGDDEDDDGDTFAASHKASTLYSVSFFMQF